MSKLGKKPITVPKNTTVKVENGKLILKGPKGSKELSINDKIFSASMSKNNDLLLNLIKKNEENNSIWGTSITPYVMPAERSYNIDDEIDFLTSQIIMENAPKSDSK